MNTYYNSGDCQCTSLETTPVDILVLVLVLVLNFVGHWLHPHTHMPLQEITGIDSTPVKLNLCGLVVVAIV